VDEKTIYTRMHFTDTECDSVDRIYLAQDTVQWRLPVNTVMNLRVRQKPGNGKLSDYKSINDSAPWG
jgi:hypothetical protein